MYIGEIEDHQFIYFGYPRTHARHFSYYLIIVGIMVPGRDLNSQGVRTFIVFPSLSAPNPTINNLILLVSWLQRPSMGGIVAR